MMFRFSGTLIFLISANCFSSPQIWLMQCTSSGPSLIEIKERLSQQQINVLNSIERKDSAVSKYCQPGDTLNAFYIWEFQKNQAKTVVPSLRDVPEDFDPKPPKRVH